MSAIDEEITKIRKIPGVKGVLIASTSGGYIAGEPPNSAHLETFTTMSAILLGAAQTATKELRDKLKHVEIKLQASRLVILPVGSVALLVIEVEEMSDMETVISSGDIAGRKIARLI